MVWREQKHILIQGKFSRINENERHISQSTRNGAFGQHKSGLTKLLKATNLGIELKARISAHTFITESTR